MLILLSPAKTLRTEADLDGYTQLHHTIPVFKERANKLALKLKKLSSRGLRSMMSISQELAELNRQRYQSYRTEGDAVGTPASLTFAGDVYTGLQAEQFTKADWQFAGEHVRILSGLYGYLKPLDLIQPYRLEMGVSWSPGAGSKNLASYWRSPITAQIQEELDAMTSPFLLQLASAEYVRAVALRKLKVPVIAPDFREERGGKYQMISFFTKKARGLMAAFAVKNRLSSPGDLKAFNTEGYSYNEKLSNSSTNKWVFTRKSQT